MTLKHSEAQALKKHIAKQDENLAKMEQRLNHQTELINKMLEVSASSNELESAQPIVSYKKDKADTPVGRRGFLSGIGIAAGASAIAAGGLANTAYAADGDNIEIGATNTGATSTQLRLTGSAASNANAFTVTTGTTGSSAYEAAIGAYANGAGGSIYNGLHAFCDVRDDSDTSTGHAIVARAAFGSRSHLYLAESGGDPRNNTYAHRRGELRQSGGDLWHCTSSGTPGTWKKISGNLTGGSLHPLTNPTRAYDSRASLGGDGQIISGETRNISLATAIPSGAASVLVILTAINNTDRGSLRLFSAGSTIPTIVTLPFFGKPVGTTTFTRVNASREVEIFCGGSSTDILLDVLAYYE